MKQISLFIFFLIFINSFLYADEARQLSKKLSLIAGKKAAIQWERVFKSKRKMKKYKIDTLSEYQKKLLKDYLVEHAADSDSPELAGEFS